MRTTGRILVLFVPWLAVALAWRGCCDSGGPTRGGTTLGEIRIAGSKEFVQQVRQALLLLQQKACEEFASVRRHVGSIEEGSRSGMCIDRVPPTIELSRKTAFYSVSWCAGAVVHDAYHAKLWYEYRGKYGRPVPDDAWTGAARELECIAYQLEAMHKIGAPPHEILYLERSPGTYADTNRDGRYTEEDYRRRNW